MRVRGSKDDVTQIASAWREAGGTFYKVELRCNVRTLQACLNEFAKRL